MTFRYARHTTNLDKIEQFYTGIIGLEKLGGFENHDHYNGLFLGYHNADWHLEFTTSADKPNSHFDDDDVLVFYVNADIELARIKRLITQKNIPVENPKNPYWSASGIMIADPDGFKIIFSVKHLSFNTTDELTKLVTDKGISNWSELIEYTRNLPYGRNANRQDPALVIQEGKGTCSSKHAFLKKIAELNNFNQVQLMLGMYKMNNGNTPKIGDTISTTGLPYIPEAHCYLLLNNRRIDITSPNADIDLLANDIMEEIVISPEQVNIFKVDYHKNFLKKWIAGNKIDMRFEEVWEIRERCIMMLEGGNI